MKTEAKGYWYVQYSKLFKCMELIDDEGRVIADDLNYYPMPVDEIDMELIALAVNTLKEFGSSEMEKGGFSNNGNFEILPPS